MDRATIDRYSRDPAAFRDDLLIECDGHVRRFGDVMDPWQCEDFRALDPMLKRCNGQSTEDVQQCRAWIERPRGAGKTNDQAVSAIWALTFAARPVQAYVFAVDRDQGDLIRSAIATLCRVNPWLSSILEIQKNQVINIAPNHPGQGSKIEIFTSDLASSWGLLPSLVICDEVHAWRDEQLWHSILSSCAKL